jgi:hypothetical protein
MPRLITRELAETTRRSFLGAGGGAFTTFGLRRIDLI